MVTTTGWRRNTSCDLAREEEEEDWGQWNTI